MDIIKNRQQRDYNYTSRYATLYFGYNTIDKKFIYGLGKQLSDTTEYSIHPITENDTLDSLALKYYGRPDLFWIIGDYNRIADPYIKLSDKFNFLYIPSLSAITYK